MIHTNKENILKLFGHEIAIPFPKRYLGLLFIIMIIGLSILLRMYKINTKDIWLDEANTVLIAENNPSGIVSSLKHDAHPPLYYFILHFWMKLFGQTETALRSLSASFGVLLVISLFFIGRKLFTTRTAIYVALFSAIAPIQVMYSQQVRMYTLLPLTSVLSMYFLLRFIQEGKNSQICWYIVSTVACLYTHHYGILLLPSQAIIIFFFTRQYKRLMLALLILGYILLRYALWLPVLYRKFGSVSQVSQHNWVNYFWDSYSFWGSLYGSLKSFSPGGVQPPYVPLNALSWQPTLPVIISGVMLLFGLSSLIKRKKPSKTHKIAIYWLLIYSLIPLITAGIVSIVFLPIYIPGRYDQFVFPAFCLLVAVGISNIKPKNLQYFIILVLLIFSIKTLDEYYGSNPKYGDKVIASNISQNLIPGDAILCTSLTRASLEYYLRNKKPQIAFFSYPLEDANHLAYQNIGKLLKNPKKLIKEAEFLVNKIRHGGSQSGRFFIVYVPNRVNIFLKEHIKRNISKSQIRVIGRFRQSLRRVRVQVLLINFN